MAKAAKIDFVSLILYWNCCGEQKTTLKSNVSNTNLIGLVLKKRRQFKNEN
jgi:hypothetical protein